MAELGIYLDYIILFSLQHYKVGTSIISVFKKRKQVEWGQVACSARQLVGSKNKLNLVYLTPKLGLLRIQILSHHLGGSSLISSAIFCHISNIYMHKYDFVQFIHPSHISRFYQRSRYVCVYVFMYVCVYIHTISHKHMHSRI